jgi:hypothetical protein
LYIYSDKYVSSNGINPSRPTDKPSVPVDNLLGEIYDKENYHMFIKGIITKSIEPNKFKIVFDNEGLNPNFIDIEKFDNDIILDYSPSYDEIEIGTKVLAELGLQKSPQLIDKRDITSNESIHFENGPFSIEGSRVKWMAVVIDKLENNDVEVMFSINSYDLVVPSAKTNRPVSESNIRKIYNVDELVLLAKAPLCI